jgi:hypothetical protein
MSPKTKVTLLLVVAALGLLGIICTLALVKYHVNKERFPDAAPWTWWW